MRHTLLRTIRGVHIPLVIAIAQLAGSAPLAAQVVYYVPGAANASGFRGSQFRTRVSLLASGRPPIIVNVSAATPGGLLGPASVVMPDPSGYYSSENILED